MDPQKATLLAELNDLQRQFLRDMIALDKKFFFIWLVYSSIVLALVAVLLTTGSKGLAIINACWFCYGVFMGNRSWRGWQTSKRKLAALDTPSIEA